MSVLPEFPGVPEPRRDRPAQTSGFETFEEMMMCGVLLSKLRAFGAFDDLAKYFAEDCEMVCPSPAGLSPFQGMAQVRFRNRLNYHYQNHSDTASMVAMSGFRQEAIDD